MLKNMFNQYGQESQGGQGLRRPMRTPARRGVAGSKQPQQATSMPGFENRADPSRAISGGNPNPHSQNIDKLQGVMGSMNQQARPERPAWDPKKQNAFNTFNDRQSHDISQGVTQGPQSLPGSFGGGRGNMGGSRGNPFQSMFGGPAGKEGQGGGNPFQSLFKGLESKRG